MLRSADETPKGSEPLEGKLPGNRCRKASVKRKRLKFFERL
jgi:hypothetical protein